MSNVNENAAAISAAVEETQENTAVTPADDETTPVANSDVENENADGEGATVADASNNVEDDENAKVVDKDTNEASSDNETPDANTNTEAADAPVQHAVGATPTSTHTDEDCDKESTSDPDIVDMTAMEPFKLELNRNINFYRGAADTTVLTKVTGTLSIDPREQTANGFIKCTAGIRGVGPKAGYIKIADVPELKKYIFLD